MMRSTLLAALLSTAVPMLALAQTADELKNDQKTPGDILTYGMGYSHQRFSPLTQINRDNVKRLVPAWSYSMADNNGQQSHPLIKDGVMYITDHVKTVALDALTGKQLWKHTIEYAPETTRIVCCGIVNRGAAILDGKLFRTTLDAAVIALDAKTGKQLWRTKSAEPKDGYSMTVAPLVANGAVIAGVAGAEFGHRGYLEAYDPQTGKVLWRTWTVPEPGQKGSETWPKNDSWKTGGGSTWLTGSYDPELDLVYWGTGNPAPWNPLGRVGDNLYTNTVLAFRPKTGEIVWHYQFSPGDPYDYDGVNELVQADLQVNGQNKKVVMQANRNGFFYVLDRTNGKVLAANKFVKVNWADGVDLETGRPAWSAETKAVFAKGAGHKVRIWPSLVGGKNWAPMSYSPQTRLAYVNSTDFGWDYEAEGPEALAKLKPGVTPYFGVKRAFVFDHPDGRGHLRAIDPLTGKSKWAMPLKTPNMSGTMVTAGGVVFTGQLTGELVAVDAESGKLLWQFNLGAGSVGQPVTWERDGKQYVTMTSGSSGPYVARVGDPNLANVPPGGMVWTFKLFDN